VRTHIVIHHSFTKDGDTVSWDDITRFHTSYRRGGDIITEQGYYSLKAQGVAGLEKPWADVGYHAGVEDTTGGEGGVQAFLGRDWLSDAAACPQGDMNRKGLHVCVVGNYDLVVPSDEHLRVLVKRVILPWMRLFGISADHIVGHRDYNPNKTCPGSQFDIDKVRRLVA
jgi:hypothetical protein